MALLMGAGLPSAATAQATRQTAAQELEDEQRFFGWFEEKEAYYNAHPELKNTPGSGWKPFNRLKWHYMQRLDRGHLPSPTARWEASEVRRARMASIQPRATWFTLGPTNFAGRMLAIEFDPTNALIAYAGGADGGVWKTTDGGASWAPKSDELPSIAVGGIAVSPLDPNIVVIGTGEGTFNADRITGVGILRSTDGGDTWNTTSLSLPITSGHAFHFIEANPINGTMLAGATDGLWRSSDSGQTWTNVGVAGGRNNYFDAYWRPGDANVCYCVKGDSDTGNNVKKSTDDGLTWVKAGTGQPASFTIGKSKIAVTAAQPDWIYAVFTNANGDDTNGFFRSTDAGATWIAMDTVTNFGGQQGWYNLSLMADPDNANVVICGGVRLYRSSNGGANWVQSDAGVHVDHHAIAYEPGSVNNVWVGSDGGIWKSTNDGTTWTGLNNGLVTYQFYDICVNNNNSTAYYVMGGTQDNGTDKWSGTTTWANGLGADGMVCNINPSNGTTVYAEIQFGDHRKNTTSGIGTYVSINNGLFGTGAWVAPVAERANPGNNLFTSTSSGLFRTTDGANWMQVDTVPATWLDVSEVNGDYVFAVAGGVRYSTDNGDTWQFAAPYGFLTGGASKVLAHPTDSNTLFVCFTGYGAGIAHLAMSTDLGNTWSDKSGDLPSQPCNAVEVNPTNPTQWFLGTDTGVWYSENGGVNWLPFEDGLPNAQVLDLEIQNQLQKLVAGTHGRGAWEINIPTPGTGVDVAVAPTPRNLMLDTPSPNPVSERTLLRYAAKSSANVSLAIYDIQGRLVSDLADFPNGDGVIRTTPWLTDDVSSGVYFAVLRAGSESISRKIVVAK